MEKWRNVAFLGSGGIARAHAFALDAHKYYYADSPSVKRVAVASPTQSHRETFSRRFGFDEAIPVDALWQRDDFDTLYILGKNETHTPQLLRAVAMPSVQRVYVEKPLGISNQEIQELEHLQKAKNGKPFIMVGYQYLQKSPIRQALALWQTEYFGTPVHFRIDYLHSSYLQPGYLQKHTARLAPIPANGAIVDLGSHALSLLIAFLGDQLVVHSAHAASGGLDVPEDADLCTTVLLEETHSGAVGTMTASRISAGTGDRLSIELRGTRGAIVFDTDTPDVFHSFHEGQGWHKHEVYSDYLPASAFSASYVPSGWLRALIHNHYLFLGGDPGISVIPDLAHGIAVQKLIAQIADQIEYH